MNSTKAIFDRLSADADIMAGLDVFEGSPAIFNDRAPDDFIFDTKAALIIAAPTGDDPTETFTEAGRDMRQDIRLYAKDDGSTADIDALARAVRDLFHNQPEALSLTGAVPIICQAAGPTVSPTTDPSLVGRRISLRLELERI
jgi:hypothetical protein